MNLIQTSEALKTAIVKGMQEKKAQQITVLDLRHVRNAMTDFFVICSATSDTQAAAITEAIEKTVYLDAREHPWKKEGQENREWILLDYFDAVAHVFRGEKRQHYALEMLWGDAVITHIH